MDKESGGKRERERSRGRDKKKKKKFKRGREKRERERKRQQETEREKREAQFFFSDPNIARKLRAECGHFVDEPVDALAVHAVAHRKVLPEGEDAGAGRIGGNGGGGVVLNECNDCPDVDFDEMPRWTRN